MIQSVSRCEKRVVGGAPESSRTKNHLLQARQERGNNVMYHITTVPVPYQISLAGKSELYTQDRQTRTRLSKTLLFQSNSSMLFIKLIPWQNMAKPLVEQTERYRTCWWEGKFRELQKKIIVSEFMAHFYSFVYILRLHWIFSCDFLCLVQFVPCRCLVASTIGFV